MLEERVRTLYKQSAPVLLANVVNALLVGVVVWNVAPHEWVVAWCSAMVVMSVARIELRRRFWKKPRNGDDARRWARYFVIGSSVAGALWGFAGSALFTRESLTAQLLISFVIGGMGAGAAGTLGCYLPAFYGYFALSMVPFVARLFSMGSTLYLAMGAMVTLFTGALGLIAVRNGRSIVEAYTLRFQNAALAQRLEEANATLEERVRERTRQLETESTARQEVERALHQAQTMDAIGRLATGLAHDFNNLLTVVLQSVDLAREQAGADPTIRACCNQALAAAERGAELTRALLAVARKHAVDPVVMQPAHSVDTVATRLLPHLCGDEIEIVSPPGRDPWAVFVDAAQFETALLNIALNAKDAMPDGGTLKLEAANATIPDGTDPALEGGDYVVVRVSDDGLGMTPEVAARAFEPFYSTKSLGRASGLGLSMVYGFAKQAGGHARLTSTPQLGTTVELYLPRQSVAG